MQSIWCQFRRSTTRTHRLNCKNWTSSNTLVAILKLLSPQLWLTLLILIVCMLRIRLFVGPLSVVVSSTVLIFLLFKPNFVEPFPSYHFSSRSLVSCLSFPTCAQPNLINLPSALNSRDKGPLVLSFKAHFWAWEGVLNLRVDCVSCKIYSSEGVSSLIRRCLYSASRADGRTSLSHSFLMSGSGRKPWRRI